MQRSFVIVSIAIVKYIQWNNYYTKSESLGRKSASDSCKNMVWSAKFMNKIWSLLLRSHLSNLLGSRVPKIWSLVCLCHAWHFHGIIMTAHLIQKYKDQRFLITFEMACIRSKEHTYSNLRILCVTGKLCSFHFQS